MVSHSIAVGTWWSDLVTEILNPVLLPLGFAPGQVGVVGEHGEVIFCRGEIDSVDGGCVDLVVEVEATPDWQITDVRYWGFRATDGTSNSTEAPTLPISWAASLRCSRASWISARTMDERPNPLAV